MKRLLCLLPLALLAILVYRPAYSPAKYPEPSIVPQSWEITFTHDDPQRILVTPAGATTPQPYWFMTYTVTNKTLDPIDFLPTFDMLAADASVTTSDNNVPPAVFDAIKAQTKNTLLIDANHATGQLLPGEDEAKDSVAIWPEPVLEMGKFSIFAKGLSGEARIFKKIKDAQGNPDFIEVKPEDYKNLKPEEMLTMWKTMQMDYSLAGQFGDVQDRLQFLGETWIMR